MYLEQTLEICAEAAHNRRLNTYHTRTGDDPTHHDQPRNPLLGHCFENTREVSWELAMRNIPHKIVRGAIAYDAVLNYPYWLMDGTAAIPEKTLPESYEGAVESYLDGEKGVVDPAIWDEIDEPTTKKELPDEASHYWVEVNAEEIPRFDTNQTFAIDCVAEARQHYGEPMVYTGHPQRFYLKPDEYAHPWERHDDWEWNPRDPEPF